MKQTWNQQIAHCMYNLGDFFYNIGVKGPEATSDTPPLEIDWEAFNKGGKLVTKYDSGLEIAHPTGVVAQHGEPVPITQIHIPRGMRNNNPGNIDLPPVWKGCVKGTDDRFCTFANMAYGIRALALLLLHYQSTYHLNTVRGIVNRWAPPVENDTGTYVKAVAEMCQVDPDKVIDLHSDAKLLQMIVRGIVVHENGIASNNIDPQAFSIGVGNALGQVSDLIIGAYKNGS